MRTKLFLASLLLAAATHAAPYKNSIIGYAGIIQRGPWLGVDGGLKYERRIGSIGLGVDPGLPYLIFDLITYLNSKYPHYQIYPAFYLSGYTMLSDNIAMKPEVKLGYWLFTDDYRKEQDFTVSPRLNFEANFNNFLLGFYPAFLASYRTEKIHVSDSFTDTSNPPNGFSTGFVLGLYAGWAF